MREKEREEI
ncbi:hypothetical protein CRE_15174 [Caenorhabditis remanei]|uniref:Uncharacterized protein n=1 Tax=Caenorhabditis remanei TaxID=31234 RepID=E3NNP1_CAERE|nr:hypothetical protein CRE_15174 [Caenorhabditis remanei]